MAASFIQNLILEGHAFGIAILKPFFRGVRGGEESNERARAWRPELVMREQLKWYDDKANNSPWILALAEVRQRATREGYCYQHVQAITVAIDQYAEKALGNRDYFLNKPYGVG